MLSRRHTRVKVMQVIYSMHKQSSFNLELHQKQLLSSMEGLYFLYANMLSFLRELYLRGQYMSVQLSNQRVKNERLIELNSRFIDNSIFKQIGQSDLLIGFTDAYSNVNWRLHSEYVGLIYRDILESSIMDKYLCCDADFDLDKRTFLKIYEKVIISNDKLYDFFETGSMGWVDDFPVINSFLFHKVKKMKGDEDGDYFVSKISQRPDEIQFGVDLLKKSVLNDAKYEDILKENLVGWDIDRLAMLDMILMKMGICEFLNFPTIDSKVTINEYIEIAKEYSTAKSSSFVNGMLNKIYQNLRESGAQELAFKK